ncbi:MAG TPA: hypothetical protein VFO19_06540 [Vicinamibacterales bacterium]|nr:hypothetical protein [Vicinamibacterales bacterium]
MRTLWISTVLAAALAGGQQATPAPAGAAISAEAVPKAARKVLNKQFPDWQFAALDEAANAACAGGPPTLGTIVQLDVDSDLRPDIAAAVLTSSGVKLVVLLNREKGYRVFDLGPVGDKAAAGTLAVAPRGQRYLRPEGRVDEFFSNATLTLHRCNQPPAAFVWNGATFDQIVIDGGARTQRDFAFPADRDPGRRW